MAEQKSTSFEIGGEEYLVDLYAVENDLTEQPVVVILHGIDGMGGESGRQIRKFAEQIADAEFLVFVPHYFNAADGDDSLPLEELFPLRLARVGSYLPRIVAAIDHAKQSGGDGPLGLVGFSLGGGLAIEYAQSVPAGEVKALVDYFGYISDPKVLSNAGRLPPTLILHNNADAIVKIDLSSKPLLAALGGTAVVHDHRFYDDANPALGNHPFLPGGPADVDSRSLSVAWLKTYLKPS